MSATKRSHKLDRAATAHLDALLDEALQETFPASDPIAVAIELKRPGPEAVSRTGLRAARPRMQGAFGR